MDGAPQEALLLREAFIYLAAAALCVPVFTRLGLGAVLGYLAAGMLIGPSGFGLIGEPADVMRFAEFGIVLLLFVIGLELRPARLWAMRHHIFGFGTVQVLVCGLALTAVLLQVSHFTPAAALVIALPLALSSTALIISYLQEEGLLNTPLGERAFSVLLLQDMAIVPLLLIVSALARTPDARGPEGWELVGTTVGAIVGLAVAGRLILNPLLRYFGRTGTREVFVIAALLMVTGAAFLMESLHLSMGMGAFIAGVMLAESPYRHEIEADIEPYRGLLLGLFFLAVGMGLDMKVVLAEPLRVALLVALVVGVKTIVVASLARVFGTPWRQAWLLGVLLSQGGEFGFVLLGAAVTALLILPDAQSLFGAVITLSMPVSLLLARGYRALDSRRREERHLPAEPERREDGAVIVIGYGRFGRIVTQMLHGRGIKVTVIDTTPDTIEWSRRFGWTVWFGDGFRPDLLRAAGAETAQMLVVAIAGAWDPARLEPVRRAFPHLKIMVRAHDRAHYVRLVRADVDGAVRELLAGGVAMGRLVLDRLGVDSQSIEAIADEFLRRDAELMARDIATGRVSPAAGQFWGPGQSFRPESPETALGEIPPSGL
jgi:monovalent cation:proton antiporter-2 (CPA2) family protein